MKDWGTSARIAIVPACLLLVLCVTVATGCNSKPPSASTSPSLSASPTPTPTKITDPKVTLSPAITKYVTVISRAEQHANYAGTEQHRAATDDLRRARAIQPKNDGSTQWSLAHRYASCVRYAVSYENRTDEDQLAYNAVVWKKDFAAFKMWWRRVQSARNAYFAYVFEQNWAGYCATGRRFTSVTATWIQPQLRVNETTARGVDIWVGLDGEVRGSNTVEQAGIDYLQGADDWAWYQMFPKPSHTIHSMVVNTGDTVTATVTSLAGHRFKLTLVDSTRRESFSAIETSRAARCASAEIIVESHLASERLADFDLVQFTNCAVDGRPIAAFHWKKTNITAIGNLVMTSTSALKAGGSSFTVTRR